MFNFVVLIINLVLLDREVLLEEVKSQFKCMINFNVNIMNELVPRIKVLLRCQSISIMLFCGVCVWIVVYGYWWASYYPPISFEAGVLVLLPKAPF